jgi:nucleoside-diphosphate-sugar epimerase
MPPIGGTNKRLGEEGRGMRVCVTGAAGKAGRAVVTDLRDHGHEVVATDMVMATVPTVGPILQADLTEYGQAGEVLQGMDAVVHLANIPAPGRFTPAVTLNRNLAMNANIFLAAAQLGLRRVVWASSETTLGLPFDTATPPRYAPVDEDHYPYPSSTYALSKVASETLAEQIAGWSGISFVALRFSNIMAPDDYRRFPGFQADPASRRWNLWGYIDVRDAATACRLALDAPIAGAQSFIIAAADTVIDRPSADLLRETFPDVPVRREFGEYDTLLSIEKARAVLGFAPRHSWREQLPLND